MPKQTIEILKERDSTKGEQIAFPPTQVPNRFKNCTLIVNKFGLPDTNEEVLKVLIEVSYDNQVTWEHFAGFTCAGTGGIGRQGQPNYYAYLDLDFRWDNKNDIYVRGTFWVRGAGKVSFDLDVDTQAKDKPRTQKKVR